VDLARQLACEFSVGEGFLDEDARLLRCGPGKPTCLPVLVVVPVGEKGTAGWSFVCPAIDGIDGWALNWSGFEAMVAVQMDQSSLV